jgi:type IV pilus assembly protein PilV
MLSRNDSGPGFTLIEVLVAMVILIVGLLGLLQSINIAMDKNVQNELRQSGVNVAEKAVSDLRLRNFDRISGARSYHVRTANRMGYKNISVQYRVANVDTTRQKAKQVSVRTWWRYRDKTYEHQTASGIGSAEISSGN